MAQKKIALLLFFAASCAHIPEHELQSTSENANCETLNDLSFSKGDWPNEKWWEEMGDPTLSELIEKALILSPTLKKAEERLKAACQVSLQKRADLYPQLNLDTADLWTHLGKEGFFRAFGPVVPDVVNDFFFGLSFRYEFDFWGKNRDLFKAALGQAFALGVEKNQAELILTTSIAYTYAELQFLLKKKQILSALLGNRESMIDLRKKRELNALDTAIDPLLSEAGALDNKAELTDLQEQIEEHIHKLKSLSGIGQDGQLEIKLKQMGPLNVALPDNLSLDLLSRRPDLVAAKARVEALAKEISAAKTNFYPNINLYGLLGLESVYWSKLFQKNNIDAAILPALHLPIFTAGKLRAELMESVARFNEAVFAYDELVLQAAKEVADGLTKIVFLQKELEIRQQSLQVAQKELSYVERRLIHAIGTKQQLLDAEQQLLQKQLLVTSLKYGKQMAEIALIRALGGGFHE